jgi:hypothetical protein
MDNTDAAVISKWEDFGMKYRGRWVPTNTYNKQDVVWMYLNKTNGKESYFVCQEEHQAIDEAEIHSTELWKKWQ